MELGTDAARTRREISTLVLASVGYIDAVLGFSFVKSTGGFHRIGFRQLAEGFVPALFKPLAGEQDARA